MSARTGPPSVLDPVAIGMAMPRLMATWAGMVADTGTVLAARMPTIAEAWLSPLTADHAELGLMVSEKVRAQGRANRAGWTVTAELRRLVALQAAAFARIAGGRPPTFAELWTIGERHLELIRVSAELPGRLLAPYGQGGSLQCAAARGAPIGLGAPRPCVDRGRRGGQRLRAW